MTKKITDRFATTLLAFRGYNVTNLGRTAELLAEPTYAPIFERYLGEASQLCADITGRPVDLAAMARREEEYTLANYAEAVSLVVSSSLAQLEALETTFDIPWRQSQMSMGFSLGELTALVAGGVFPMSAVLRVPVALAEDCAALAEEMTLGVLFSRKTELPQEEITRLCLLVNHRGEGVMGVSAYLSPNTVLLMGQRDTLSCFMELGAAGFPKGTTLRRNEHQWPPLHTPIIWERNITTHAARLMHTIDGGFTAPRPAVMSLVTGKISYNDYNARELIGRWIDHPQRLWDGVYGALSAGIDTVIHVGPSPNIIPATFQRLAVDVEVQTRGSLGMRSLSAAVRRPWLRAMLPARSALLRAPLVRHVVLEDWLLEHAPGESKPAPRGVAKES